MAGPMGEGDAFDPGGVDAGDDIRRRSAFVPRPGSWPVRGGLAELLADADRPGAYLLAVDEVAQSYVDLIDPTELEFGYVQAFALLIDALERPAPQPIDVVHVGGGAATLARWVVATRPQSFQVVFENDAALAAGLEERIGTEGFSYRIADGRDGVASLPDASADVIVTDAFVGNQVPPSLTTVEFLAEVRRVLRPGGWYACNVADADPFAYARRIVASVAAVMPVCAVVAEPSVLRGRRFGNLVVVGSTRALPVPELDRALATDAANPQRLVHGENLDAFVGDAAPLLDGATVSSPAPPSGFSIR
jgi:spermidine synthase